MRRLELEAVLRHRFRGSPISVDGNDSPLRPLGADVRLARSAFESAPVGESAVSNRVGWSASRSPPEQSPRRFARFRTAEALKLHG
jgi:hypothetical protein